MNPFDLTSLMQRLTGFVRAEGVALELCEDMEALYRHQPELEGKTLSPLFRHDLFDMQDAFWIKGTRLFDGKLVHVQASKLEDTGRHTLAAVLPRQLSRCYDGGAQVAGCPAMEQIRGRLAYHGDTWVSPAMRGKNLGGPLTQIGLLATYARWQPDFVYAFFEHGAAFSGFGARSWYTKMERMGRRWNRWLEQTEYLAYMSRDELDRLVALEAR
jgi:hypothetical protein